MKLNALTIAVETLELLGFYKNQLKGVDKIEIGEEATVENPVTGRGVDCIAVTVLFPMRFPSKRVRYIDVYLLFRVEDSGFDHLWISYSDEDMKDLPDDNQYVISINSERNRFVPGKYLFRKLYLSKPMNEALFCASTKHDIQEIWRPVQPT